VGSARRPAGQGPSGPGRGAIFLLTDYGTADELVGVVRAVLTRAAPGAGLVDLTHEVAPFDVRAGALALRRAAPHLGPGVVLAVVDPGVGTDRRAVALSVGTADGPQALVGPDNGLLVWAADVLGGASAAVVLPPAAGPSATFDGRDVFAPAAAALWSGEPLGSLGSPLDVGELVRLAEPRVRYAPGRIEAEVLWVDRFGNVQLAATAADDHAAALLEEAAADLEAGGRHVEVPVVRAFAELPEGGGPGVLVDANGHLAVVCDRDRAATVLGVRPGDMVVLRAAGAR